MSAIEVLAEQFSACYDDDVWFVSLKTALDGVTAEQAAWKPEGAEHSIWGIVNHLTFWTERWLRRSLGQLGKVEDVDNPGTFHPDESDWQATVDRACTVMEEWRSRLAELDDEYLNGPVSETDRSPWWSPLAHQNIHNAYHIGQILLLRRLQGSWDPAKGVS